MRVILAGTRSFGAATLEMLVREGHDVAGVVAPWGDRTWDHVVSAHRRGGLAGTAIAEALDPRWVADADVDLIVGAHSHAFVGRKSRAATRLGALGYHPSLLPRHRGKDAVAWTVRMGDPVAGGSVYWFTDHVDGGPIAAQDWCHVRPGMTASDLWSERLFPMGVELLCGVLRDLDRGTVRRVEQNEAYATWEPSLDAPPLYRPELPAIGSGPAGFTVLAGRQA